MIQFYLQGEKHGGRFSDDCPPFSENINYYFLTANEAKTITPPSGSSIAFFDTVSTNTIYYIDDRKIAVIPTGDITNGSGPDLNPTGRIVSSNRNLSVISPTNAVLRVMFYS